jgi:hypothetical protein
MQLTGSPTNLRLYPANPGSVANYLGEHAMPYGYEGLYPANE